MEHPSSSNQDRKRAAELRALKMAYEVSIKVSEQDTLDLNEISEQYLKILSKSIASYEEAELYAELIKEKGGTSEFVLMKPKPLDLSPFLSVDLEEDKEDEDSGASVRLKRGSVLNVIVPVLAEGGSVKTPAQIIEMISARLGQYVPTSTITNSLTRLIRANRLKKTSDSSTSYYGIPEWFNGEDLKPEFSNGVKGKFELTNDFVVGADLGTIEANLLSKIIDEEDEEDEEIEDEEFEDDYTPGFTVSKEDDESLPF